MPNLKVILISPLRRALQSAYFVFKDHPNFKNVKVILVPDLRESLQCTEDIPAPLDKTIETFNELFPNFDYSLLDYDMSKSNKDLWFLENLPDKQKNAFKE